MCKLQSLLAFSRESIENGLISSSLFVIFSSSFVTLLNRKSLSMPNLIIRRKKKNKVPDVVDNKSDTDSSGYEFSSKLNSKYNSVPKDAKKSPPCSSEKDDTKSLRFAILSLFKSFHWFGFSKIIQFESFFFSFITFFGQKSLLINFQLKMKVRTGHITDTSYVVFESEALDLQSGNANVGKVVKYTKTKC